ncbi:hypothetical protein [Kribbella sp.]|uniref:hypothetical protein n=1 Tax=Kribbella sp. TaxID=1871183 RepID=UPI002D56E866|nr:hypothetical protein [Kribbella sp.]HZX05808.1 hypothetical protein [Kribbella sp.]
MVVPARSRVGLAVQDLPVRQVAQVLLEPAVPRLLLPRQLLPRQLLPRLLFPRLAVPRLPAPMLPSRVLVGPVPLDLVPLLPHLVLVGPVWVVPVLSDLVLVGLAPLVLERLIRGWLDLVRVRLVVLGQVGVKPRGEGPLTVRRVVGPG